MAGREPLFFLRTKGVAEAEALLFFPSTKVVAGPALLAFPSTKAVAGPGWVPPGGQLPQLRRRFLGGKVPKTQVFRILGGPNLRLDSVRRPEKVPERPDFTIKSTRKKRPKFLENLGGMGGPGGPTPLAQATIWVPPGGQLP